jgi:hypothetical protein
MQFMLENPLILSALASVGLILVAVSLAYLGRWLFTQRQGYPNEEQIEDALREYVVRAILFAYKQSELMIDFGQDRLRGLDKKRLADFVYDMLPNQVAVPVSNGKVVYVPLYWIKGLVSREQFSDMVQGTFDRFLEWHEQVQLRYGEEIGKIVGEYSDFPVG